MWRLWGHGGSCGWPGMRWGAFQGGVGVEGRGRWGLPDASVPIKSLAHSRLPLEGLMVCKGPGHPRSEQRRFPVWGLLCLGTRGVLLGLPLCAIPENSTTKGIHRWYLTTRK